MRQAPGVCPNWRVNRRVRWLWSLKPHAVATSARGEPEAMRSRARCSRNCMSHAMGGKP